MALDLLHLDDILDLLQRLLLCLQFYELYIVLG